jgi:ribonuclease P protein component
MKSTVSLNQNHDFKRLYYKGRSYVSPAMAVYVKQNRFAVNRLGVTASTKLGCAVKRNRARRRLKETYRLLEPKLKTGFDVVIVARFPSIGSPIGQLNREMLSLLQRLGVIK